MSSDYQSICRWPGASKVFAVRHDSVVPFVREMYDELNLWPIIFGGDFLCDFNASGINFEAIQSRKYGGKSSKTTISFRSGIFFTHARALIVEMTDGSKLLIGSSEPPFAQAKISHSVHDSENVYNYEIVWAGFPIPVISPEA